MKEQEKTILPIASLEDGKHTICFSIGDLFIEANPIAEIEKLQVSVNVFLERRGSLIKGIVDLSGSCLMQCDRCLDLCEVVIKNESDFTIVVGGDYTTDDALESVYRVSFDSEECNITDLVFDTIVLGLPAKRDHGEDAQGQSLCNNEVSSLVNKYLVKNDKNTDPRWDGLTNIKFN